MLLAYIRRHPVRVLMILVAVPVFYYGYSYCSSFLGGRFNRLPDGLGVPIVEDQGHLRESERVRRAKGYILHQIELNRKVVEKLNSCRNQLDEPQIPFAGVGIMNHCDADPAGEPGQAACLIAMLKSETARRQTYWGQLRECKQLAEERVKENYLAYEDYLKNSRLYDRIIAEYLACSGARERPRDDAEKITKYTEAEKIKARNQELVREMSETRHSLDVCLAEAGKKTGRELVTR